MALKKLTIGTFILTYKGDACQEVDFIPMGDEEVLRHRIEDARASGGDSTTVTARGLEIPADLSDLWEVMAALDVMSAFEVRLFMIELVEFGMSLHPPEQRRAINKDADALPWWAKLLLVGALIGVIYVWAVHIRTPDTR